MKMIKTILLGSLMAAALALSPSARALAIGDAYYIGSYTPNNFNPTIEGDILSQFIDARNGLPYDNPSNGATLTLSFGASVPATLSPATFDSKEEDGTTPGFDNTIDVTGVLYLIAKYGGGQQVGTSHIWYVGGLSGNQSVPNTVTVPTRNGNGNRGLSHISLFGGETTRVPDAGTTLVLLGAGMLGLGALRRRLSK